MTTLARLNPTRFLVLSAAAGVFLFHPASVPRVDAAPQQAELPGAPLITHEPVECVIEQRHPLFRASVQTEGGLHTVKLYFHAQEYSDYYYVEMVGRDGTYEASLPMAAEETKGFAYYIEAVDLSFNTARTAEYVTLVTAPEECEDSEEGAPPVVVGSTSAGASAVPPGFLATGIERFISSTGAAQGAGSGALTAVLIGAGAAAGATVGILGGGDDEPTPEPSPPPEPPPTPPPGPPPGPEPSVDPLACFQTEPNPPVVDINESIRFDASCSKADAPLAQVADEIAHYQWTFGDGRPDKEGRVVNRIYVQGGTYVARLTVTDSQGNEDSTEMEVTVREDVAPPGGGGGGPDLRVNVSVSPSVVSAGTPIVFTINVNYTEGTANDVMLNATLSGPITGAPDFGGFTACGFTPTSVSCGPTNGSSFQVTVTVVPAASPPNSVCSASVSTTSADNPGNNSSGASATVNPQLAPDVAPEIDTSFTSRLELPPPDGSVRGQVLLNGTTLHETNNAAPFRHHLNGQKGRNTVEARLVSGTGEGQWVFNFAGAPHFVDGSLAVESGQVIAQGSDRIVFRVSPSSPPLRFRFRLSE